MSASSLKNVCYDMTHANDVVREYKDKTPTLQQRMGTGGNQVPIIIDTFENQSFGEYIESDKAATLIIGRGVGWGGQSLIAETRCERGK